MPWSSAGQLRRVGLRDTNDSVRESAMRSAEGGVHVHPATRTYAPPPAMTTPSGEDHVAWWTVAVAPFKQRPYLVRLSLRLQRVPTDEELGSLEDGPHKVATSRRPHSRRIDVELTMRGIDVLGVDTRATHHVLERLPPAEVVSAEIAPAVRAMLR
jgi:hypothetical protein